MEKKNSDEKLMKTSDCEENPEASIDYESETSTDSESSEKCPICLLTLLGEIGRPHVCQHSFCFQCIQTWSQVLKTCPIDRREFNEINVFDYNTNTLLRTVPVNENNISINEIATGENEVTACEICRNTNREDVMLLCDSCDRGFHTFCLTPPLTIIPLNNWYCSQCEAIESDNSDEEEESENENENEVNEEEAEDDNLSEQPQILRTLQSERIRNAILARRSLRGAIQFIEQQDPRPSTSSASSLPTTSRKLAPVQPKKPAVKKRKAKRRRRRVVREVVEYGLKDGQKFPIIKTRKVTRRKRRKTRKASRRKTCKPKAIATTSSASSFKSSNKNVYGLQRDRQLAGLSNFNIFEPTNQLDYVPDEDEEINEHENGNGRLLTQSIVNYNNPLRRQALIKKRVIENCTTTASVNILDSILNEQHIFTSGKLLLTSAKSLAKQSTSDNQESNNDASSQDRDNSTNSQQQQQQQHFNESEIKERTSLNKINSNDGNQQQSSSSSNIPLIDTTQKKTILKKKKRTFDMFEDSPMDQDEQEEERQESDNCPNFSIYDSCNRNSDENLSHQQHFDEENVDLVQMSDDGEHIQHIDIAQEIEPAVVRTSQPASPDLENDVVDEQLQEERSYTPPIATTSKESKDKSRDDKSRRDRDRDHRRHKRRELERYNVRERLKEKSPARNRDRFGRNRTRSRSNSRNRRRKSRSPTPNRERSRRSKDIERRRKRSYSRSASRRRESSNERKHKKSRKKSYRRSKSRSPTPPRYNREKSPRRRDRSTSDKSKKKKHRNRSKEKSSAHTKEVFKSGQNILVSVNFNNQEEKRRSNPSRSKSKDKNEAVVDITAKKKINVSTKPVVAIIDLARSPFRELTPEYKKESNVIELSDSEGEKHQNPPKSPDSTKLYDPFDILNSPSNENVSSSQNSSVLKSITRDIASEFTNKLGPNIIKNLPLINSEENLVSSSSSVNVFDKIFAQPASKVEVLQNEVVQHQNNVSMTMISSPYSPGNDDDTYRDDDDGGAVNTVDENDSQQFKNKSAEMETPANIFDELFGSTSSSHDKITPAKSDKKSSSSSTSDPSKYLTKLKRQERVIEEVKLVIKPYYSKRIIDKEQYKEIMRKAVPKICHNRSGEINPTKIKHLIDSYVKMYTHKKKRSEPEEMMMNV